MIVAATCSTVLAALSAATGGDTILLTGNCGPLTIDKKYASPVTIDATSATIAGLRITGSNIVWKKGKVSAQDGMNGWAAAGYAAYVSGDRITFVGTTFTNAKMGLVATNATNFTVKLSRFVGLRADGISISLTKNFRANGNTFSDNRPLPTTCTYANGSVAYGLSQRDCTGVWKDGDHPDAIQMRNGVENALIDHNTISGPTQGITQMDTAGDLPLAKIRISYNSVAVTTPHSITLYANCADCKIDNNKVVRGTGSTYRAVIREGAAFRCGNYAPDDRIQDAACPL